MNWHKPKYESMQGVWDDTGVFGIIHWIAEDRISVAWDGRVLPTIHYANSDGFCTGIHTNKPCKFKVGDKVQDIHSGRYGVIVSLGDQDAPNMHKVQWMYDGDYQEISGFCALAPELERYLRISTDPPAAILFRAGDRVKGKTTGRYGLVARTAHEGDKTVEIDWDSEPGYLPKASVKEEIKYIEKLPQLPSFKKGDIVTNAWAYYQGGFGIVEANTGGCDTVSVKWESGLVCNCKRADLVSILTPPEAVRKAFAREVRLTAKDFCGNDATATQELRDKARKKPTEFKIGDVVELKSGGPAMTVTQVPGWVGSPPKQGDVGVRTDLVTCYWFDGGEANSHEFQPEVLKLYVGTFSFKSLNYWP
jgi:uncharacterized protein YodC (DUF2158 family)